MVINRKDLLSEFRKERGQIQSISSANDSKPSKKGKSCYETFLYKMGKLEEYIDLFSTRDLVYYFREIAEENGYRYVISNIKKDMAIMKRARENFSNREICGMIEFLYMSEQTYLKKDRLSPNLLVSNWVNTIYADTKLWVSDSFNTSKPQFKGEWDYNEEDTEIGVEL